MAAWKGALADALAGGVTGEELIDEVARLCGFCRCPRVIAMGLRFIGRSTQFKGVTLTQCCASELVYVDGRWVAGKSFFSLCGAGWAERFEFFLRQRGNPIIVSRHGASRDKQLIAEAFAKEHIMCSPISAGCSSFAPNSAFPDDPDEIPSFLNVLNVTPADIVAAAK